MPRAPRQLVDGGIYHLIARGNNRQVLFTEEAQFRYFLDLLARAKNRYPAKLYHYCLMSNHVHLLLEIAAAYAEGVTNTLLDEDPYYAQLGSTPLAQQAAYRDYVRLESPYAGILDSELVEAPF